MVRHRTVVLLTVLLTAEAVATAAPRHKASAKKHKAKKAHPAAPTAAAPVADTTAHAYLRAVTSNDRVGQGKILAAGRRAYLASDGTRIIVFPDKSGVRVHRDGSKTYAGADVDVRGLEPAALVSSI